MRSAPHRYSWTRSLGLLLTGLGLGLLLQGCGKDEPAQPTAANTFSVLAGSELRDLEPLLPESKNFGATCQSQGLQHAFGVNGVQPGCRRTISIGGFARGNQ